MLFVLTYQLALLKNKYMIKKTILFLGNASTWFANNGFYTLEGWCYSLVDRLLKRGDYEDVYVVSEHPSLDGKQKCTHYSDGGVIITNI